MWMLLWVRRCYRRRHYYGKRLEMEKLAHAYCSSD